MIGAMPAIAVRRGGKKGDGSIGYFNRPHKLSLHFRPPILNHPSTPTPSPMTSPQGNHYPETSARRLARHCATKRVIFQLSVLAPLAGALTLFIGLLQYLPGAEESSYRLPLLIVGLTFVIFGLIVIAIRLICKWEYGRHGHPDLPEITVNEVDCNVLDVEKANEKEKEAAGGASGDRDKDKSEDQQVLEVLIDGSKDKDKSDKDGGGGGGGAPVVNDPPRKDYIKPRISSTYY